MRLQQSWNRLPQTWDLNSEPDPSRETPLLTQPPVVFSDPPLSHLPSCMRSRRPATDCLLGRANTASRHETYPPSGLIFYPAAELAIRAMMPRVLSPHKLLQLRPQIPRSPFPAPRGRALPIS